MKLANIVETEDPEWASISQPLTTEDDIRRRMLLLNRQADLMTEKFERYAKIYKGQVFAVTGLKSGLTLPKQVQANPRKFMPFTCVHNNPDMVTKVFVDTNYPKIVLAVRSLVHRHNELTNVRGRLEGKLAQMKRDAIHAQGGLIGGSK